MVFISIGATGRRNPHLAKFKAIQIMEKAVMPTMSEMRQNGIAFYYKGWQRFTQSEHKKLAMVKQDLLRSYTARLKK